MTSFYYEAFSSCIEERGKHEKEENVMKQIQAFLWSRTEFLSGEYVWKDGADNVFMHFQSSFGGGKLYVVIEPFAANIPELSLLAIIGRYLEKMQQRRRAATVAAMPT